VAAAGSVGARRQMGVEPAVVVTLALLVCLGVAVAAVAPRFARLQTVPVIGRVMTPSDGARRSAVGRLRVWPAIITGLGRQLAGREVIPAQDPLTRNLVGYGLDTQEFVIDALAGERIRTADRSRVTARRTLDRAHDVFLDQVVTSGVVGAALWITILVAI